MQISSTRRIAQTAPIPTKVPSVAVPSEKTEQSDSFSGNLVRRIAEDPLPKTSRLSVLLPATGGLALGVATGMIGNGLGAGAAIPGLAVLGLAGASMGSRLDGLGQEQGSRWSKGLAFAGLAVGAVGIVAGTLGGVPGAVAGAVSLGGTGFALGHLYSQAST